MTEPLSLGLTGGIGAGKSAASAILRSLGGYVIDYDVLAREAVEIGSPGLTAIAERFGTEVLAEDGSLDRPALGAIVFSDEKARRDLEAITHPAIKQLAVKREQEAGARIVIHDNPLLVEMGGYRSCDVVIVIDVPEYVQVERLMRDRAMTAVEAEARIAAQASRQERAEVADYVVDNTGSLQDLETSLRAVWTELASR